MLRHWRNVWEWAGVCVYVQGLDAQVAEGLRIPATVEFDIPGMVKPYDRMRFVAGRLSATGDARLGVSLQIFNERWGGWAGGVIDHKDIERLRDAANIHLQVIAGLSESEKYRLQQDFAEMRRLRQEWSSDDEVLSYTTIDAA